MDLFKSTHLSLLRPEDIVSIADPNINALSVTEVLSISQTIEHQLLVMKQGILGSDIEPFFTHLLSTGLGGGLAGAFPRMPTSKELHLCRRLAQIADEDIVTQMQILRMLDVFRKLTLVYHRVSLETIQKLQQQQRNGGVGDIAAPAASPTRKFTGPATRVATLPPEVAELVELNSDIAASTAALTEGTMFQTWNDGVIPTYVLYQLAARYGIDARSWFKRQSAVTLLPNTDEVVVALRYLMDHGASGSLQQPTASNNNSSNAPPPASPGATKTSLVPVEFISASLLTDTFSPLDEQLLRLFRKTFGAFDPNDPMNELQFADMVVDGHLMLILPISQFARVLRISEYKAKRLLERVLDGTTAPQQQQQHAIASSRRKYSRSGGDGTSLGTYEDIEDVFGSGIFQPQPQGGASSSSSGARRSISLGNNGNNASGNNLNVNSSSNNGNNANQQQQQQETSPAELSVVIARGYLRYPEFHLVMLFLNGTELPSMEKRREEQQMLVDAMITSHGTLNPSGNGTSSSSSRRKMAPEGDEDHMLMDEQAAFIEKRIFTEKRVEIEWGALLSATKASKQLAGTSMVARSPASQTAPAPLTTPASSLPQATTTGAEVSEVLSPGHSIPTTPQPAERMVGGGQQAGSTMKNKNRRHHNQKSRKTAANDSGNDPEFATVSLHGWPIHQHDSERLSLEPYNGRDAQRLRRSVVASPERTIHSFVVSGSTGAHMNRGASAVSEDTRSSTRKNQQLAAEGVIATTTTTAATVDDASLINSSSKNSAVKSQTAALTPRERELARVVDVRQLRRVLASLPEDPVQLMSVELRPQASNFASNTLSPSALSAPLIQAGEHIGFNASHSVIEGDLEFGLSTRKSLAPSGALVPSAGRGVASTKAPYNNTNKLGGSTTKNPMAVSVRDASSSLVGRPPLDAAVAAADGATPPPAPSSATAATAPALEASSQRLGVSSITVKHSDSSPLHDSNNKGMETDQGGQPQEGTFVLDASSPEKAKHGIHEVPWRSVHYIPKLPSEGVGEYCSSKKRSGGGFGARGVTAALEEVPPPPHPDDSAAPPTAASLTTDAAHIASKDIPSGNGNDKQQRGDNTQANTRSRKDVSLKKIPKPTRPHKPQPCDTTEESRRQLQHQGSTAEPQTGKLLDAVTVPVETIGVAHVPAPPPVDARQQKHHHPRALTNTRNSSNNVAKPKSERQSTQQRVPSAQSSRRGMEEPDVVPVTAVTARDTMITHEDPSPERHQRPPRPLPNNKSNNNSSRDVSVAAPPRGGALVAIASSSGIMAVMDASKYHHGSMLSFIPPALAAECLGTLDLRFTYPPALSNFQSRYSVSRPRPSLLQPLPSSPSTTKATTEQQSTTIPAPPAVTVLSSDPLHSDTMQRSKQQIAQLRFR